MSAPGLTPALRPDLLRVDVNGAAVIWPPGRVEPSALDPVSTVMLDIIDGVATLQDLAQDVHEVIGIAPDVALSRVESAVNRLDSAGALLTSLSDGIPERQPDLFTNPPST